LIGESRRRRILLVVFIEIDAGISGLLAPAVPHHMKGNDIEERQLKKIRENLQSIASNNA